MSALLLWASLATADQGLRAAAVIPPVDGKTRLAIQVTDPEITDLQEDALSVGVGLGEAKVDAVRRVSDTDQTVHTVLAFDQSGSFSRFRDTAVEMSQGFSQALPPTGHSVQVVGFGVELVDHGIATDAADLDARLVALSAPGEEQRATRLKAFVADAIELAADAQPVHQGGGRQVLVFSDIDDESNAFDFDELAQSARVRGVQVHMVVFDEQIQKRLPAAVLSQRLDDVKRFADSTGGSFIQVRRAEPPSLARLAALPEQLYWLDVHFCGIEDRSGHVPDTLTVRVSQDGQARAWTSAVDFTQHAAGLAVRPCGIELPPVQDQRTQARTTDTGSPLWIRWLLGLLGVLGLLVIFGALARRQDPAPATPEASPPPPPPTPMLTEIPDTTPQVDGDWRSPFQSLPGVSLETLEGPAPKTISVHKSPYRIGADASLDLELCVSLPQLSGHHATLQVYRKGRAFVTDEGSTNGTFVDGRRLLHGERAEIRSGQELGLSRTLRFRVRIEEPPT